MCSHSFVIALGATTGLFCLSTVLLTVAVIALLIRDRRRSRNTRGKSKEGHGKGRGKVNESYWIELQDQKMSASTPNLSEWASSPPPNTFFPLPLERMESLNSDTECLVISAVPVVPEQRVERRLRKSLSFCDLMAYKNSLVEGKPRRRPPSPPPSAAKLSSGSQTPSPTVPHKARLSSPSDPRPMPRPRKKRISILLEENHKSELNEYNYDSLDVKPPPPPPPPSVPSAENSGTAVIGGESNTMSDEATASGEATTSGEASLSGMALITIPASSVPVRSTPLYETLIKEKLDEPSEYETITEFLGPLRR